MSWSGSIQAVQRHPLFCAGLVFMLYSMLASVTIQFLLLPHVLPGIHAGHGLLAGGDYPSLHSIAARMASRITDEGWSAWEVLPDGQSGAGLASAIYAFIYPEPWALIPFNAAFHAVGGVIVMRLIQILSGKANIAFAGGALYVFFPSAMNWVSQIQKDSTYFAGMLGVLLGLIALVRAAKRNSRPQDMGIAIMIVFSGLICIGIARFYGLELVRVATTIIALMITPPLLRGWWAGIISTGRIAAVAITIAFTVSAGLFVPQNSATSERVWGGNVELPRSGQSTTDSVHLVVKHWERNRYLPDLLDRTFMRIAIARYGWSGATYATAGSKIDADVGFTSALQVIEYFPRALQIGLGAPFPEHWFAQGSSPGGTAMRRVSGIEMLVLYPLFLLGLPLATWRWRRRIEYWMICGFCFPVLTLCAYVVPNVGALHRLRYGFLMPLAALGLAAIWLTLQDLINRSRNSATA